MNKSELKKGDQVWICHNADQLFRACKCEFVKTMNSMIFLVRDKDVDEDIHVPGFKMFETEIEARESRIHSLEEHVRIMTNRVSNERAIVDMLKNETP